MKKIDTIIFDFGGVLIDWNPIYVYLKVFKGDKVKTDWFLNNICTSEWNIEQDAGRSMKEATDLLVAQHPQYEDWIRMYYDKWEEMLSGSIEESVKVLKSIKNSNNYRLYGLTNWSAETFHIALKRFDFLHWFEGIVVSGEEKTRKPFKEIYEITLNRYNINPDTTIFIDDNEANIEAASQIGLQTIHFKSPQQLVKSLANFNIDIS